jgi:LDH2 family malate/lactate/ureidoglycolate dehydrogenase
MGEYKGAGLALMLGLIAGVLNGAAFGRDVIDFNADDKSATNTGHFIIAVDISRFVPLETFKSEVDRHIADLRASKRLPGVDEIRLPGDRRAECRAGRARDGVPLPRPLLALLDKLAAELKIKPLAQR